VVPPCSDRISRVPPYSSLPIILPRTGLSPAQARLSMRFQSDSWEHWPRPRSLATTNGVSVDVLSSRYLDVSVPWVRFESPMYSGTQSFLLTSADPNTARTKRPNRLDRPTQTALDQRLSEVGFPIRKSSDQSSFAAPRSLSQRTTSFIASQCQGIHRMPLRRLIALIIDAHRQALAQQRQQQRKTILLREFIRKNGPM
jgi:hypothetical protein